MTLFESIPSNLKFTASFLLLLVVFVGGFLYFVQKQEQQTLNSYIEHSEMRISSFAFEQGGIIPTKYTCDGDNVNPPLNFESVPSQTVSLVLLVDDPDVPVELRPSGNFDHWVIFNMPGRKIGIDEDSNPGRSVIGLNSAGENKYKGPCPPDGQHRYFFRLYSLDTKLDLDLSATKADVIAAMDGHINEVAELMGTYKRK
jgi:Raf kinase inhibitor-like YbhB/YbcL family protein